MFYTSFSVSTSQRESANVVVYSFSMLWCCRGDERACTNVQRSLPVSFFSLFTFVVFSLPFVGFPNQLTRWALTRTTREKQVKKKRLDPAEHSIHRFVQFDKNSFCPTCPFSYRRWRARRFRDGPKDSSVFLSMFLRGSWEVPVFYSGGSHVNIFEKEDRNPISNASRSRVE